MPFRFRKYFKIAPGIKINLSKSGISTSIGKSGASLNLGKHGVRTTIGLPGTGLSFSTTSPLPLGEGQGEGLPWEAEEDERLSFPSDDQPDAPADWDTPPSSPFIPPPPPSKIPKIPLNCLIITSIAIMLFSGYFCVSTIITGGIFATPTPTIDLVAIQAAAMVDAWFSYTQTAAALPTITPTPTFTPAPTETPLPTFTSIPLPTQTQVILPSATMFISILPANQPTQPSAGGYCCKYCANSQPCGDSCISLSKTCHQPPGCACK